MAIVYLYDATNGYRYRHFGLAYYERISHNPMIVSAWIVPNSYESEGE